MLKDNKVNTISPGFVTFGICAMEKKVKSRPMIEILTRLKKFSSLKVIVFPQSLILNVPVKDWPICDSFLSFYSHGFPLEKSIKYVKMRKPFLINNVEMQDTLRSRVKITKMLEQSNILVPRHIMIDRSDPENLPYFTETDDSIEMNGKIMMKPFVEKPFDAENHNIYIYFPSSAGGGRQELFRKVGNKSSRYVSNSSIRRDASYLYEEFIATDGTDIKVYTVGPDYAHAEARKSPALDGKVERDNDGKEVRYPIILSQSEKLIAKNVISVFQQQICGVDLLRVNGISYICDVNGFSFVKTSQKYFDDCSYIIGNILTRRLNRNVSRGLSVGLKASTPNYNLVKTTIGKIMELRCIIAVIRHGDRTPKQKIKLTVTHKKFHEVFRKYAANPDSDKELKLKKPSQLQEILNIINYLLTNNQEITSNMRIASDQHCKYVQLKTVLELYGHFSGINRKVQLKYKTKGDNHKCSQLVIIMKWGGELTAMGIKQAESLGCRFRGLYPGGTGLKDESAGQGLLRLHSTYRHDLKIYASDEGRVQMTAGAFARGFLALEGELPPILAQMVKSANTNGLLDNEYFNEPNKHNVKKQMFELLSQEKELSLDDYRKLAPCSSQALIDALKCIGNPFKACQKLYEYINIYFQHLNNLKLKIHLYHKESWDLLLRRWRKLTREFYPPKGKFDLSKVPDIYDNIKYDLHHNPLIIRTQDIIGFFKLSKCLADIIVPQEYGITKEDKLSIAQSICTPLLRKIKIDTEYSDVDNFIRLHPEHSKGVSSPDRFVRTRLYFTSESHIHSLLSCIRYGQLCDQQTDPLWEESLKSLAHISELNYLSQIVIMIYENPSIKNKSEEKLYHVELQMSPGSSYVNKNVREFFKYCIKKMKYEKRFKRQRSHSDTIFEVNYKFNNLTDPDLEVTNACNLPLNRSSTEYIHEIFEENIKFPCESEIRNKLMLSRSSAETVSREDLNSEEISSQYYNSKGRYNSMLTIPTGRAEKNFKFTINDIYPLCILHNKLTLKDLSIFLQNMISKKDLQYLQKSLS